MSYLIPTGRVWRWYRASTWNAVFFALLYSFYPWPGNNLYPSLCDCEEGAITHCSTLFSSNWGTYQIAFTYTYLLTPWCRDLLEKLIGLQLVKKFPAFHGTRRFITALISVRHLSLSWASPYIHIHIPPPNIIHPSTSRPPQWSLSLRLPHQDPIHHPSSHPYTPNAQPISFLSILSPAQYWVRITNHLAPRFAISSIPPLHRPS